MQRRVAVVTGANSGIGLETAVALASAGDRVVIACRDDTKASAAVTTIVARSGSEDVERVHLDLITPSGAREAAQEVARRFDRLDVLVNNAGLILDRRTVTPDGFEAMFAVNHLGHFSWTDELTGILAETGGSRVINVASAAHWFAVGGLDFDDLDAARFFNGWLQYGRTKLANILFTQELARRVRSAGICVSSLHPGTIASGFGGEGDTAGVTGLGLDLARRFMRTPEAGADCTVWLATSSTGADLDRSGGYWTGRRPGRLAPWARRRGDAARLWSVSEDLAATN
ncbi:MAG: SDR family NAD(P)-dependent oxidoreductase [Microthrixaceae bacterium]